MSKADELLKYKNLLDMGAITQEEFDKQKNILLSESDGEKTKTVKAKKKINYKPIVFAGIALALIIAGVFVFLKFFGAEQKTKLTIQDVENSVVKVNCYNKQGELVGTGSGFVVFDSQTFVTNYHVLDGAYSLSVGNGKMKDIYADSIVNCSEQKDIAILHLEKDSGLTPLTLGDSESMKQGEAVIAIGSPIGLTNTVSDGLLSAIRTFSDMGINVFQISAPISHGSSGGALFNANYEVIGVTFAGYQDGENLNLAIPISEVQKMYKEEYNGKTKINEFYKEKHDYSSIVRIQEASKEELKEKAEWIRINVEDFYPEEQWKNGIDVLFIIMGYYYGKTRITGNIMVLDATAYSIQENSNDMDEIWNSIKNLPTIKMDNSFLKSNTTTLKEGDYLNFYCAYRNGELCLLWAE